MNGDEVGEVLQLDGGDEAHVWDAVVVKAIEWGASRVSAVHTADWLIEQRRLRLVEHRKKMEELRRSAEESEDRFGIHRYTDMARVPGPEMMEAEGHRHLGVIKGGKGEDDSTQEPWFLDCESEEGGMIDVQGSLGEIYESLRDHRYAIPGEAEEILAWMNTARVGAVMHYSKGIIVRIDPAYADRENSVLARDVQPRREDS